MSEPSTSFPALRRHPGSAGLLFVVALCLCTASSVRRCLAQQAAMPLTAAQQATAPAPAVRGASASPLASTGLAALSEPADDGDTLILVMSDGLRWQEVFGGADETLLSKEAGGVADPDALRARWWRPTAEERRALLMPFLWSTVATSGQLFGNRALGSDAHVTNGKNFSYPGYNETLCGFADPRIDSNDPVPNPNVTVLEWLAARPGFAGRVAAFGAWDCLPAMLNRERCGFLVNACFEPVPAPAGEALSPRMELLNELRAECTPHWDNEVVDALLFHAALEHFRTARPRVLYVLLGETDEWAHARNYRNYLEAAHRADDALRRLWEAAQQQPASRGRTSLLVLPDHGRGRTPADWTDHGAKIPGAEEIWLAALGPAVPALGERRECAPITQNQVAATLAALLGEDYAAAVPAAGKPIADVLPQN